MELSRILQVRGEGGYGSGYMVAPGIVLTANHLLQGDQDTASYCQIRPAGKNVWVDARPVWRGNELHDAAVLTTAAADLGHTPPVFGEVGSEIQNPKVIAIGVPPLASSASEDVKALAIYGELSISQSFSKLGFIIQVTAESHQLRDLQGMSGAPVFADQYLIGIVTGADISAENLLVLPIADLARTSAFCAAIKQAYPLRLRQVRAPVRSAVVNFSQFHLEQHVRDALDLAWRLSGNRPVGAGHLLKAVALISRTRRSVAFRTLASLLNLTDLREPEPDFDSPNDLAAMQVTQPLAQSFSIAEGFFKDKQSVWGRDFITFAVLAKDDPSLQEVAQEAGGDIETIRSGWLAFIRPGDRHRDAESWADWWRGAGFPIGDDDDTTVTPSAAFLLKWNPVDPSAFKIGDRAVAEVKEKQFTVFSMDINLPDPPGKGDRVFLLRRGPEPQGLVGVGTVQGPVKIGADTATKRQQPQEQSTAVNIRWTALSQEPFVDMSTLIDKTDERELWSDETEASPIPATLLAGLETTWRGAWSRHKQGLGLADDHLPELEPKRLIARLDADSSPTADSINIDRHVNAFARVMASKSLTPPLSIGLFGDWGSGKTYFMDKLHSRIAELSHENPAGHQPLFLERICQIHFNAWHYAETHLWASLVSTIFHDLRVFLDGKDENADEFNKLLNQLELAGELRKEADRQLEDAVRYHSAMQEAVTRAEKTLRDLSEPPQPTEEALQGMLRESISEAARTDPEELVGLLNDAAKWSGRKDLRQAAQEFKRGGQTVEQAMALLEETRTMASRAGFWWRILLSTKLYQTWGFWILLLALLVIPAGFFYAQHVKGLPESWAHLSTTLAEIVTVAGAAIAWARSRLASAGPVFDRLDALQSTMERKIEDARSADRKAYEAACAAMRTQEKDARKTLREAQKNRAVAAEEERKARKAVAESTSQARLGRFIRERASSVDYEKHLGLIAMIHRDFKLLSDLMQASEQGTRDPDLPTVDRIILYIDDLDRCHPPEKVVRVLEAVHLLLFFPLFVVVVGVDSRWISRALYRHYEGMLADEAMLENTSKKTSLERAPAESQDFLEKIFQVPFWLETMDEQAVKIMIHNLVPTAEIEQTMPIATSATPPPVQAPETGQEPPEGEEPNPDMSAAEDPATAAAKFFEKEAAGTPEPIETLLAAPTESLRITDIELKFMQKVAPLMPRTPRSVKRFVNIYRLYKSALSTKGLARFLGTPSRPGNFRAVQVLLALVSGSPGFARAIVENLRAVDTERSPQRLSDLVDGLKDPDDSWEATIKALRKFAQGDNNLEVKALRDVSNLVSRYSVHQMVSEMPGETVLS